MTYSKQSLLLNLILLVFFSSCSPSFNFTSLSSLNALNDDILALAINNTDTIDVLANDTTPNLTLTGFSVISSDPSVTFTQVDSSRIQVSGSGDYQGNAIIQYHVVDDQGTPDSALLTVHVGYCSGDRLADTPFANSSLSVDGSNQANAFHICSFEQFNRIGTNVANLDRYFELHNDIDFTGQDLVSINGIGNSAIAEPFSGTFHGRGYAFENISFTDAGITGGITRLALFRFVHGGTVSNIRVPNAQLVASNDVINFGFLINNAGGFNPTLVTKIDVSGSIVINAQGSNVGGILAEANSGAIIEDVKSNVNITITGGTNRIGGIIGTLRTTMRNCFSLGTLIGGQDNIGGILGLPSGGSLFDCFTNTQVTGSSTSNHVGVLVGSSGFTLSLSSGLAAVTNPVQCTDTDSGSCNSNSIDHSIDLVATPNYFFNNQVNPPFNNWDWTNDWQTQVNDYPEIIFEQ